MVPALGHLPDDTLVKRVAVTGTPVNREITLIHFRSIQIRSDRACSCEQQVGIHMEMLVLIPSG